MIWRWIIRGLCLALLTPSVTVWVGSHYEAVGLHYAGSARYHNLQVHSGYIIFMEQERLTTAWQPTWRLDHDVAIRERAQHYYAICRPRFCGFGYGVPPDASYAFIFLVFVPIWFPTLLSALLLWLVWRKTRPKYNGRGFPVEAAGKEATKP